jgi:hypothetical protein
VPVILVSFGYAARPLDGLDPDAMIDHFRRASRKRHVAIESCWRAPLPFLIRLNPAADRSYFDRTALNEEP